MRSETMTGKRFSWDVIDHDCLFYDDGAVIDYDDVVDILNEQHENLKGCNKTANNAIETIKALTEENQKLKETLNLIADAKSFTKEESVKDILRHEIYGIDTAAGESANAFHEYMVLSTFFKKHYKEHWDND